MIRITNMLLEFLTNPLKKTYALLLELVLLFRLLQHHGCLCEFGLQQLLLQVSVLEDLLQVLDDIHKRIYERFFTLKAD